MTGRFGTSWSGNTKRKRSDHSVRLLEAVVGRTTDLSTSSGSQSLSLVWTLKCFRINKKQIVLSTTADNQTTRGRKDVKGKRLRKNVLIGSTGEPGVFGVYLLTTLYVMCLLTKIAL